MKKKLFVLLPVMMLGSLLYGAAADLDPSFGTGGKVITPFDAGTNDDGYSVAIQEDGKIVVAGCSDDAFALVRYNTNGSLDTTFGSGGKVTTPIGMSAEAKSVAIQGDGKIVAAGTASSDFTVARYNADGSLDPAFGSGGTVMTSIKSFDSYDNAESVAIQDDGKIVVAGRSNDGSSYYDFALVRYDTNGSLDTSFDSDGIVTTQVGSSGSEAYGVAIQSDGKIVAAGYGSGPKFVLTRYNTDGSLDTAFGTGGVVTTSIGIGRSVALQSDGKIVMAGYTTDNNFIVARYDTDGLLDTAFGTDGVVITPIGVGTTDHAFSVAIQGDGKIVVAGSSGEGIVEGSGAGFALVRYNTNGSLDTAFGTDGKVTTSFGEMTGAIGYSVAIQDDTKIVVAGSVILESNYDFAVVRYMGDASASPSLSPVYLLLLD